VGAAVPLLAQNFFFNKPRFPVQKKNSLWCAFAIKNDDGTDTLSSDPFLKFLDLPQCCSMNVVPEKQSFRPHISRGCRSTFNPPPEDVSLDLELIPNFFKVFLAFSKNSSSTL